MTRVAVLADIHGNIPALEAVAADIASQGSKKSWWVAIWWGADPRAAR